MTTQHSVHCVNGPYDGMVFGYQDFYDLPPTLTLRRNTTIPSRYDLQAIEHPDGTVDFRYVFVPRDKK